MSSRSVPLCIALLTVVSAHAQHAGWRALHARAGSGSRNWDSATFRERRVYQMPDI